MKTRSGIWGLVTFLSMKCQPSSAKACLLFLISSPCTIFATLSRLWAVFEVSWARKAQALNWTYAAASKPWATLNLCRLKTRSGIWGLVTFLSMKVSTINYSIKTVQYLYSLDRVKYNICYSIKTVQYLLLYQDSERYLRSREPGKLKP